VDSEQVISSTAQLKAVSNPLRMRMLEQLIAAPHTASQLGAVLHMAPSRAHYHLKQLESAGLCRLVEQRAQGSIVEKYYRAVAARFRIARTVAAEAAGRGPAEAAGVAAELDATIQGYLQQLHRQLDGAPGDPLVVQQVTLRLTPERYARLLARLHAVLLEFDSASRADHPGQHPYRILLLAYPEGLARDEVLS